MVLRSLAPNISVEMADKMDEYRKKEGNDLSNIAWYRQVTGFSNITIKAELIKINSSFFRVVAAGMMKNMTQIVNGVVKKTAGRKSCQTITWRLE
jgi:hypothetical protein